MCFGLGSVHFILTRDVSVLLANNIFTIIIPAHFNRVQLTLSATPPHSVNARL